MGPEPRLLARPGLKKGRAWRGDEKGPAEGGCRGPAGTSAAATWGGLGPGEALGPKAKVDLESGHAALDTLGRAAVGLERG